MKRFTTPLLCLLLALPFISFAQNTSEIEGAQLVVRNDDTGIPRFIRFQPGEGGSFAEFDANVRTWFEMGTQDELRQYRVSEDQIGYTHYRFQQYHQGKPVQDGNIIAHVKNGEVVSVNGEYYPVSPNASTTPSWNEQTALEAAKVEVGAGLYKWEIPAEEEYIKIELNDPTATYVPHGELTYLPSNNETRLAWKFDIYAQTPESRSYVWVDASNGEVLRRDSRIHDGGDHVGTAVTTWSGTQTIITDSTPTYYRLHDSTRGNGIITKNMETRTQFNQAVDFTDADNYWDNVNPQRDETATDCHWSGERFYDYFDSTFGRKSFDDSDGIIRLYVHYGVNWDNASWDGTRARFGANGTAPANVLDVVAHELGHGVTEYTADLVYRDESGALNESFSDIFGVVVERFSRPNDWNWLIGEEWIAGGIRSMSNPSQFGDPDTYFGNSYFTGTGDNGGVHTNSAVQNHWFYLLTVGGSGTNDNGDAYTVNALGMDKAAAIAYRNLDVYLTRNSNHADARFYSIQAAIDLYGACSEEMKQTMNAWHAVGVGGPYTTNLTAAFTSDKSSFCSTPAAVQFSSQSLGEVSYLWKFGDGATSTLMNPTHTYSFANNYDVTLIVTDCAGNKDTLIQQNMIIIDLNMPCEVFMPQNSSGNQEACEGTLKDSGGDSDYLDNNTSFITIAPPGATSITLNFASFEFATSGDYIVIYDGPDDQAPLLNGGYFNGTNLPNGGVVTSSGGAITLKEVTNGFGSYPGFEATWSCVVSVDPALEVFQNLSIFPNPASEELHVVFDFSGTENLSLDLTDLAGKKLRNVEDRISGHFETRLDVSDLAPGLYLLRLNNGTTALTRKVVIQ